MGKNKVQKILKNLLDKLQKLYINGPRDINAYCLHWHDFYIQTVLIHKIYKLFSTTVVRFVEMNFERFHQQSQPYAFRVPEKFSTL